MMRLMVDRAGFKIDCYALIIILSHGEDQFKEVQEEQPKWKCVPSFIISCSRHFSYSNDRPTPFVFFTAQILVQSAQEPVCLWTSHQVGQCLKKGVMQRKPIMDFLAHILQRLQVTFGR